MVGRLKLEMSSKNSSLRVLVTLREIFSLKAARAQRRKDVAISSRFFIRINNFPYPISILFSFVKISFLS